MTVPSGETLEARVSEARRREMAKTNPGPSGHMRGWRRCTSHAIPASPRGSWRAVRRLGLSLSIVLALGSMLTSIGASSTPPTPLAAMPGAGAAPDDSVFEAPPFPRPPVLVPRVRARRWLVSRAELTYRRVTGEEIGGWYADLYLPRQESTKPTDELAEPGAPSERPLVVVLPIGGGTSAAERFARLFAGEGFAVLNLLRPPETAERVVLHSLRGTEKGLVEDTSNLRRAIAWARALPGIDPARVGVIGVSRGAIVTALAAEIDPTLRTVLVIGGADLPRLFRDSRLGLVKRLRKAELARAGGDMEKALVRASAILANVDPVTRKGRLDPSRTLLINAKCDHVIPKAQALALREAAGGAPQIWIPTGHYVALLYAGRVRRLALDHFERTLGSESRARITGGR